MKIERFEDLLVWQKARELTKMVYASFSNSKDYGFKDQICRASVSVMNNIAEGFERKSNKEFNYFLYVAKGSCGEVRSMVYVAEDLKKISDSQCVAINASAEEISKMIAGLIKKVESSK